MSRAGQTIRCRQRNRRSNSRNHPPRSSRGGLALRYNVGRELKYKSGGGRRAVLPDADLPQWSKRRGTGTRPYALTSGALTSPAQQAFWGVVSIASNCWNWSPPAVPRARRYQLDEKLRADDEPASDADALSTEAAIRQPRPRDTGPARRQAPAERLQAWRHCG